MANQPFHNPTDFGCFDITTSQLNQALEFSWDTPVIAGAKIAFTYHDKIIKSYTVGNGLTLSNSDQTVTLELDGADFEDYEGHTLKAHCNFFVLGNTEVTFDLQIIKSAL
jgi:hypothetical protein